MVASLALVAGVALIAWIEPVSAPGKEWLAVAYLLAYAAVSRIEYRLGTGSTVPTQLVLVPMLFALPPAMVPAVIVLADLLSCAPEVARERARLERGLLSFGDALHALGPAAVFAVAGVGGPDFADWAIYAAALGAQFGVDFLATSLREWRVGNAPIRSQLGLIGWVYTLDALLAPVGLLAAFAAAAGGPYAFLLVLPFAAVFAIFTREREANIDKADQLNQAYRGTARLLAEVLDDASEYAGSHSRDVVGLCSRVSEHLGLGEELRRQTELTALLHDIGKIAIPKHILDKPAALSEEEWALMRTHTIEGQRMLDQVGGTLAEVGRAVRGSHERWDGSGYPDGTAGEDIPKAARIVCCCDAFHAMTSDRPYRPAMPFEKAAAELRSCAGSQFDPVVVDALLEVIEPPAAESAVPAASRRDGDSTTPARPPAGFRYATLTGELEAHAEHIAAVAHATQDFARANSRAEAGERICVAAQRMSGASRAILFEPLAGGGYGEMARAGEGGGGKALLRDLGQEAVAALAQSESGSSAHLEAVIRDGRDLGAIAVVWPDPLARLPEVVAATMRLLAAEAAVAMERTDLLDRLKAAVRIDQLTGTLNRNAWREELRREIARARRESKPLSVALLDVDHFKRFNDRNGHVAGDALLRSAARAWRDEMRLTDHLGRYGGDEFIVLLSGCDLASGLALVERLSGTTGEGQTCSVGIAQWNGEESATEVIERADVALLEAKRAGRDQVACAGA